MNHSSTHDTFNKSRNEFHLDNQIQPVLRFKSNVYLIFFFFSSQTNYFRFDFDFDFDFKNNINKQKQTIDIEIGKTTMQRAT